MVIVTIKLSLDTALALKKQKLISESQELLQVTKELQIELKPMHPDAQDTLLIPWYKIELRDDAKVDYVISRMLSCKGVEAAYVKPPDELP